MEPAADSTLACAGWDIGGAHLKLALVDAEGRLVRAAQYATPLWEGLHRLERVLADVEQVPNGARHALTMTGELVDVFPSRRAGVERLLEIFAARFPGNRIGVYAGAAGFLPLPAAATHWQHVASANWHATARLAAVAAGRGFLVDIGSTTTDIVPLHDGLPAAAGSNDFERLRCGELVYTGVLRTPVMAMVQRVPFQGRWQNVAAELFATMADVYRVTGQVDPASDLLDAADGGGKDRDDSLRRLARMLGTDLDCRCPDRDWQRLCTFIADRQLRMVDASFRRVQAAHIRLAGAPVIGAGCGRFLARNLARRHGREYVDFETLAGMPEAVKGTAGNCTTAIAVALLGRQAALA